MRVAINGFGRIGRAFFKIALENGINVVAINDLAEKETLEYLLKYDSVYGKYNKKVKIDRNILKVGLKKVHLFSEADPYNLPWKKLGVDVVIESTGRFRKRIDAERHLKAGAKKVIISAPAKDSDITVVLGVNDQELKKEHEIISMASCTTNCLAPVVKILNDKYKIKRGFMTTIHAYTNDQTILDGPHKDLRRGRTAGINFIPTTSGATTATEIVIPKLKGRLDGLAIRGPIACGSLVDFTAELGKSVTTEGVNRTISSAAKKLKGILEYTKEPIVSSDIIKNPHSSIVDGNQTKANRKLVKIISWYDNEYGYSSRLVDLVKRLK